MRAPHDVDDLLALMAGADIFDEGEDLDHLDHGLQCAALLAERQPDDAELQVAGLLHDIGTVLVPGRVATHARRGAAAVAPILGERMGRLVAMHVDAKRYLVTTDPAYRGLLSEGSIISLAGEGGALGPDELAAFGASAERDAAVSLRRADDEAKVVGLRVPGLDRWEPVLRAAAARAGYVGST